MDTTSNLISLRISEEISNQIEEIGKMIYEKEGKELNTSDIIRHCIKFTSKNMYKQSLDWEEFMNLMKAYIKVAYFQSYNQTIYSAKPELNKTNVELLEDILYEVNRVGEEYEPEEIEEVNILCDIDEPEPIQFLSQLLRFKHRLMPEIFLSFMGVDNEEFDHLSIDELAKLVEEKLRDDTFKDSANAMFNMKL